MILIHLRNFKNWIVWSWTYLWAFWFLLVVFVLYYLRGPLKISENIGMGKLYTCLCSLWDWIDTLSARLGSIDMKVKLNMTVICFLSNSTATMFLSSLTPKFYVALTGTSSLISGLILVSCCFYINVLYFFSEGKRVLISLAVINHWWILCTFRFLSGGTTGNMGPPL